MSVCEKEHEYELSSHLAGAEKEVASRFEDSSQLAGKLWMKAHGNLPKNASAAKICHARRCCFNVLLSRDDNCASGLGGKV